MSRAMSGPGGVTRVVVFGFDAAEASQIRRIDGLLGAGFEVDAYTMRRRNMNEGFTPHWRNVHLGEVENERTVREFERI